MHRASRPGCLPRAVAALTGILIATLTAATLLVVFILLTLARAIEPRP